MTRICCSSRIIKLLLLIISFLHGGFALTTDGLTLLSLMTHWTFVPPLINSSWKVSDSNPCSWVGVQCDHANNLISLNLTSHGIFGKLGPEIGNLYHLQNLVLLNNDFSGKVPLELSNCSLLEYLDLSENRFSGNISYSLRKLQNLQFMILSSNLLTGEIPDSLFEIPSLEEVNLHSNLLSGPIPTNIGNSTKLLRLYLYGNMFSGTIPSSLGNCSKLEDLGLSFNHLRGEIPISIWRISSLVHILVENNSFSGELPFEMTKLKYLKNISLFDNQFSGVIPQSLGINSSIVKLDCMNNKFSGNIPPNLCFGKHLLELNMGINQLQGGIPSDVGRCETLTRLLLNQNNFTGSLPDFDSDLNLKYMDISKNNISGPIPSSLGKCKNLTFINLSWNKFAGLIPSEFGNLVNLVILDLSHNNLEGPLPLQLSNCTNMDRFNVGFNFLNGSLPSSLRSWTNISTLILRENYFTGGIPRFLAEFSNLRELQLGGNLLGGKIPQSIVALHNLFYGLNLSANGLTGGIPAEIRKLKMLQSLDISLNNLTGSIGALGSLVSLIEVNISYNLFNGSVPTGLMKLLNSSPSSFMGNPLLCASCLSCIKTSYVNSCVYKSTDHKGINNVQIVMIELGSSIFISVVLLIVIRMCLNRKESESITDSDPKIWNYISRGAGWIGARYAHEFNVSGEEKPPGLQKLVLQATENLSDQYIIGRGAHGIVYKAFLGQQVYAVKKFEFTRNRGKQQRMMYKEIEVLGMYKHRNMIKFADYWIGEDYGLVLYEFMENGSLHDILHEKNPPPPLTWNVRFNIAVGIAEGLSYLHNNCDPPIVHRDIKPKNILIDDNMEPIIADFGTALYRKLSEDSYSHSQTRKTLSAIVVGTPGYIAPENAYTIVQSRKSDVYGYGVVLLELITRKKVVVPALNDEEKVTSLVSWARSVWLETGKIECIADSYLAREFPNSEALTKQVTTMFLLALQCTERDLRKRPTMKDVIGLYKNNMFRSCDEEGYCDVVPADTSLQPYSPNIFPNIPVVSIDHHLHGETSRAASQRQREVTFNVETEPHDYIDRSFWQDVDQIQSGLCVEDDRSLIPTIYIEGLSVKLMRNGKTMAEKVRVLAALNVPIVTYVWPSLTFLPTVVGPIVTKPFNWFFLSRWGQYMHLHKSLYYQAKSYFINANKINALQDLVLEATENLNHQYIIGKGAHCSVYKVALGQQVFAVKKFEFGRTKRKQPSTMCNEIEVLGMFKHRNLIKYTDYWIGAHYGLVLYKFMENGNLHDILHEKKPPPPFMWSNRFKIAVGIAQGLAHLHYNCISPIVHRDIKSKSILLDDNMEPIIADFGTAMLCDLSEDSDSHFETRQMFSSHINGTQGYTTPENAYAVVQSRKSDVYCYGVVLLELITRKKVLILSLNDETEITTLVSWARSVWLETRKIEYIADSYLAREFPNSMALTKQVTTMFLLALQCTEKDLRKRPTMKDVIGLYKNNMFRSCDEEGYCDVVPADTSLQPYSPNIFPNIPVVSINHHLHGESSRVATQRQREVTFNMETGPMDYYSDFSFWQDVDQLPPGFGVEDDWSPIRTICIDGILVKLMGNGKIMVAKIVAVAALNVPKVTYLWPSLIFLPSVIGPVVTKPFNWFFLSRWGQYMQLHNSLYNQAKSYFINTNKINSLQDLVLEATQNLSDHYIIGRGAHCIVYKVILGQQVFALKKFEFGRNKQKQLSIMCNEIEVLGMFKHQNLIKYAHYWIGRDYGLILYKFMENGSLHDILHEKKSPPPFMWSDRFKIAVGIAQGLAHLHYNCIPPIVHRAIKPKNILLGDNMEPIIANFGASMLCDLFEDSYSHCETRHMLSSHIIGTQGYTAPENANAVVQNRKSDVYSYGVVLLELITRKKMFVPSLNDETKKTTLVSWARSIWLETGKIEKIVDSYLASSFPNSVAQTKQVTLMFLMALQCTETDLRRRPTMKEVIDLYKNDLCNLRCGEVEFGDAFVANTTLQPYSPCNVFSDVPVVSIDDHLHEESSKAAVHRQREVTFNAETEPRDNNGFRFWQDADQFPLGVYDWDDWKLMSRPAVGIDGLVIKLMKNCETEAKTVVVAALIVPKITYSQPCLIYIPSITGPTPTELFNWFFLSHWGQYMHQQKSLYYQPKSYLKNANQITFLQDLVLELTEQYIIGRGIHDIVYKVVLGQKVFSVKKFEFGRNKQKQLSIMCKEIEVQGMYRHQNLIKYIDYWIGGNYGLVLYEFMENGSLHDILHEKTPPPPLTWNVRFKIAVGIAQGLAYLHYDRIPPTVHRDIKPKNILLGANMEPLIADLGTALLRELPKDSYSHSETRKMLLSHIVGTPGYFAPENAYVVVQSRKSDVYSYGVVLLELITRKKVFVPSLKDETKVTTLVNWARSIWLETGKIEKIADSYLASSFPYSVSLTKQVTTVFLLALQCTDRDLRKRPTMKDVIGLYENDLFKWMCGEVEYGDAVAANTSLQPYIPYNLFPDDSVVGIDYHLR